MFRAFSLHFPNDNTIKNIITTNNTNKPLNWAAIVLKEVSERRTGCFKLVLFFFSICLAYQWFWFIPVFPFTRKKVYTQSFFFTAKVKLSMDHSFKWTSKPKSAVNSLKRIENVKSSIFRQFHSLNSFKWTGPPKIIKYPLAKKSNSKRCFSIYGLEFSTLVGLIKKF